MTPLTFVGIGDVMDTLEELTLIITKSTEITPQYLFGTSTFEEVTDTFPLKTLTLSSNLFEVRIKEFWLKKVRSFSVNLDVACFNVYVT